MGRGAGRWMGAALGLLACVAQCGGLVWWPAGPLRTSRTASSAVPPSSAHLDLSSVGWGVITVHGQDRLKFLHGLTTSNFLSKPVGSAISTCFLSGQGKVLAQGLAIIESDHIKIVSDDSHGQRLQKYLDSLVFPADDVRIGSSPSTRLVLTLGGEPTAPPCSATEYHQVGFNPLISCPVGCVLGPLGGLLGFISSGYLELRPEVTAMPTSEVLAHRVAYELLRILVGRPRVDYEIVPLPRNPLAFTPFELGLEHVIERGKGCYCGQEVVSVTHRALDRYAQSSALSAVVGAGPVKRRLMAFNAQFASAPLQHLPSHTILEGDGEARALLTSSAWTHVHDLLYTHNVAPWVDVSALSTQVEELLTEAGGKGLQALVSRLVGPERAVLLELLTRCIVLVGPGSAGMPLAGGKCLLQPCQTQLSFPQSPKGLVRTGASSPTG